MAEDPADLLYAAEVAAVFDAAVVEVRERYYNERADAALAGDTRVHPFLGVAELPKVLVEEGLYVTPGGVATGLGRLAARFAPSGDSPEQTAERWQRHRAGTHTFYFGSVRIKRHGTQEARAPEQFMRPFARMRQFARPVVLPGRDAAPPRRDSDLLMSLFVTLCDLRGLVLVPAPRADAGDDDWDLRTTNADGAMPSEFVPASDISQLMRGAERHGELRPATAWALPPGRAQVAVVVWAMPQSLSLDPFPVGYLTLDRTTYVPRAALFVVRFQDIVECAWEHAAHMVHGTGAHQRATATLLQLTSQIQLALYSELAAPAGVLLHFRKRAFLYASLLQHRRLLWWSALGANLEALAQLPTEAPATAGLRTTLDLVTAREWLYTLPSADRDPLMQWRVYKSTVAAAYTDRFDEFRAAHSDPAVAVELVTMDAPTENRFFGTLANAISPFQLNLVVYAQLYFLPAPAAGGPYAELDAFWAALRSAAAQQFVWTDANEMRALQIDNYTTQERAEAAHNQLLADFLQQALREPQGDVWVPGAPPYGPRPDAPRSSSADAQRERRQKRLVVASLRAMTDARLNLYQRYIPIPDGSSTAGYPNFNFRFVDDWSTLCVPQDVPARVFPPEVRRRQTPATPADALTPFVAASEAEAYVTAYRRQDALLLSAARARPGGTPDRPALYAPEAHPNARVRLLAAYVRYLWAQRARDYPDGGAADDGPAQTWDAFMQRVQQALPQLRALNLLAFSLPEARFFELAQDLLTQSTPLARLKTELANPEPTEADVAAQGLPDYDLLRPYRCLLQWLTREAPDAEDDTFLAPVGPLALFRILDNVHTVGGQRCDIFDRARVEYARPKQAMSILAPERGLARRAFTLEEAASTLVRSPQRAVGAGETRRDVNVDPAKNKTVNSGLNRTRVVVRGTVVPLLGYDIPSASFALEDALMHTRTGSASKNKTWQLRPAQHFSLDRSALSWASQHRLADLALVKYCRIYLDQSSHAEQPWEWNGAAVQRATLHAFRRFLAHHYLPSGAVLDAGMAQASAPDRADHVATTLRQLAWAALVYGGTRSHHALQCLLEDAVALAVWWFQSAEEAQQFADTALAARALAETRMASPGATPDDSAADVLARCGWDVRMPRAADPLALASLNTLCREMLDTFVAPSLESAELRAALAEGLMGDMQAGATLAAVHAMHMLETVVYRHKPAASPTADTPEARAAGAGWIGVGPPTLAAAAGSDPMLVDSGAPLVKDPSLAGIAGPSVPAAPRAKKAAGSKRKRSPRGDLADPAAAADERPAQPEPKKHKREARAAALSADLVPALQAAAAGAAAPEPADYEALDEMTDVLVTAATQPRWALPAARPTKTRSADASSAGGFGFGDTDLPDYYAEAPPPPAPGAAAAPSDDSDDVFGNILPVLQLHRDRQLTFAHAAQNILLYGHAGQGPARPPSAWWAAATRDREEDDADNDNTSANEKGV